MNEQLWREPATLTRARAATAPGDLTREIIFEGPLRDVVAKISSIAKVSDLHISLPDRRSRPFSFDAAGIRALVDEHKLLTFADRR